MRKAAGTPSCFICGLSCCTRRKVEPEKQQLLKDFCHFTNELNSVKIEDDSGWREDNLVEPLKGLSNHFRMCVDCETLLNSVMENKEQVDQMEGQVRKLQLELLIGLRSLQKLMASLLVKMTGVKKRIMQQNPMASSTENASHVGSDKNHVNVSARDDKANVENAEWCRMGILNAISNLTSLQGNIAVRLIDGGIQLEEPVANMNDIKETVAVKVDNEEDEQDKRYNNSTDSPASLVPEGQQTDSDYRDEGEEDYESSKDAEGDSDESDKEYVPSRVRSSGRTKTLKNNSPKHRRIMSTPNMVTCGLCDKSVAKRKLSSHRRLDCLPPDDCKCSKCGKQYQRPKTLLDHQRRGCTTLFTCKFCNKSYEYKLPYIVHLSNVHGVKPEDPKYEKSIKCSVCGILTRSHKLLLIHQLTHKDPEERERKLCQICGKSVRVDYYEYHVKNVCGPNNQRLDAICEQCGKSFKWKQSLRMHIKMVHTQGGVTFSCHLCGKGGFKSKRYLQKHLNNHTDKREFVCGRCGGDFKNKKHLTRHEKFCDGSKKPRKPRYSNMLKAVVQSP